LKTDYSKTVIYKLVKNDDFENANVYVGSTSNFIKRKYTHKSNCCNENCKSHNLKVYKTIRENGGWDNWRMLEIEKYPCNDNREAEAREEYWRCEFNAKLNSKRAFITKEQFKEYQKEYRTEHADNLKQYQKEYYTENADKIKQYYTENADKINQYQKEYRIENADKIKQYRIENADKINQYRIENADKINKKCKCQCGGNYTHINKTHHFKTKKHQNFN
jgi:hypothetical protein